METLTSLIGTLKKRGVLKNKKVLSAFKKIDRKYFVSEKLQHFAYEDRPLPIGYEQTISQPFTIAFMLELLDVQRGENVLDVGSGSGYTTALLAEIVGPQGKVIGVEIIPELVTLGKNNIRKYHFMHAEIRQSKTTIGVPRSGPYDKILVSAETHRVPVDLLAQLKIGGRMILPIDNAIWKIKKQPDESLEIEKYEGFVFVPLIINEA